MSITFAHYLRNFRPSKKIQIRFDFLRFRIRCMHFDRKGWRIRKNGKTHAKISDSVCKGRKCKQLKHSRPLKITVFLCGFYFKTKFLHHDRWKQQLVLLNRVIAGQRGICRTSPDKTREQVSLHSFVWESVNIFMSWLRYLCTFKVISYCWCFI